MNNTIKVVLCNSLIHIDIGKRRFSGNEELYEKHLKHFLNDTYYASVEAALKDGDYSKAIRSLQRLKI
jgi:hypothetical protein